MINKPAAARKKFVFVSENEAATFKILATAACEVVSVNVTAGGSAATFRLVDSNGAGFIVGQALPTYNLESGPSFAVESSNSYSPNLNQPMIFTKGVVLVCEQGVGSNAECLVTLNGN